MHTHARARTLMAEGVHTHTHTHTHTDLDGGGRVAVDAEHARAHQDPHLHGWGRERIGIYNITFRIVSVYIYNISYLYTQY
jgi:hypothetical protein